MGRISAIASWVIFFAAHGTLLGCQGSRAGPPQVFENLGSRLKSPAESFFQGEQRIRTWCQDVSGAIGNLKWDLDPCDGIEWVEAGTSVQGRPLVYTQFGKPDAQNTTLILTTIHGDEVTPLYLAIQIANWMRDHRAELTDSRVVIAPLVNPDSFFRTPRTRVNARGVDVNRNFETRDWHSRALQTWKKRFRSDPRRFPGSAPRSEPETIFQEELIKKIKPNKILSIHAPLNFLDYDGPTKLALAKFPSDYVRECLKLRARVKAVSGGFFPGSLGNYAGQELGIPTLTLELPSANPRKADQYWRHFSTGIRTMIEFVVPNYASNLISNTGT